MADLDGSLLSHARGRADVRLAPNIGEGGSQLITGAGGVRFGPFSAGDYIIAACHKDYYMRTGDATVLADVNGVPLSGVQDFVMPDGATHVALFSSESGARGSCWKG